MSLHSQSIDNHHSDPRRRNFYGVWVAPPAVAMIAYSNLNGLDSIDDLQRVLFCKLKRRRHDIVLLHFPEGIERPYTSQNVLSWQFISSAERFDICALVPNENTFSSCDGRRNIDPRQVDAICGASRVKQ